MYVIVVAKNISHSQSKLLCCNCNLNYHTRCVYHVYTNANVQDWICFHCAGNIFPFNGWQLAKMKKSIPDMSLS